MVSYFDYLKAADILVGLMVVAFSGASGLIFYLHRRLKVAVSESTAHIGVAQEAAAHRIDQVERDLKQVVIEVRESRAENGRIESRLTGVEQTVRGLPSREDLHGIMIALTRTEGRIDRIDERLKPIAAFAERMQDWMLEQGR